MLCFSCLFIDVDGWGRGGREGGRRGKERERFRECWGERERERRKEHKKVRMGGLERAYGIFAHLLITS